jgi:hypothetical protein
MKKARFLCGMIFWAVLVQGASFGSQSGKAPEQTPSQSAEKSANSSSPDRSKDTQTRGENENEQGFPASRQGTPKRRPSASQANPGPSRQLRSGKTPTANNLRTVTPRNTLDSHQTSSTVPSEVPNKPPKHAGIPVPPPTAALNGQQFKNSRDPGARMATSGGSANSPRGAAGINGSDIKRKP